LGFDWTVGAFTYPPKHRHSFNARSQTILSHQHSSHFYNHIPVLMKMLQVQREPCMCRQQRRNPTCRPHLLHTVHFNAVFPSSAKACSILFRLPVQAQSTAYSMVIVPEHIYMVAKSHGLTYLDTMCTESTRDRHTCHSRQLVSTDPYMCTLQRACNNSTYMLHRYA
jgi:hypothetical protein